MIRLFFAVLAVAALMCGTCAADEYRIVPVTGWSAGFLKQSQVDKLLGVPGVASSLGDIRTANCNAVVPQVRRRADVCYPSAMGEPYMSGLTPSNFNALQAVIDAAHDTTGGKKRIEVHCWLVAFRTGTGTVYAQHSNPSDPDNYWMTCDSNGAESEDKTIDPGHPKAQEYIVNVIMDMVNNYDIDGIHFDYIRFTNTTQGYNPTSVARFNARYGRTGLPPSGDAQFKQWRRDQITAVVRKVYAKIQEAKPWVKLSGSFICSTPSPKASTRAEFQKSSAYLVYSDWDSWIQEGIIDFAAPMVYFNMTTRTQDYINWINFQKDRKGNRLMVPDAGTYLNYLPDAINMLSLARDPSPAGNYADGFGAYSYQSPYALDKSASTFGPWSTFSSQLISQITPQWADIPDMPWKSAPVKGHIGGTVTAPPGNAWADGATVTITGPESRTMTCDGTGYYAFIDLTPGTYTVEVSYGPYRQEKTFTVTAGQIENGDFALTQIDISAPIISDVSITDITDGTAKITWLTDMPCTCQVDYDFVPHFGQSTDENPSYLVSHTAFLQGLNPNTDYTLRIKVTNMADRTTISGSFSFKTKPVETTIIIDDLDEDYCILSGNWIRTSYTTGWASSFVYRSGVTGTPSATAVWAPVFPRSGPYKVSTYYHAGANRTTNACFTVNSPSGSEQTIVNQQASDYTWVQLGPITHFDAGKSGNVTLTSQIGTADGLVVADAVKFEYLGDITPPIMSNITDERYTDSTTSLNAQWAGSDPESGIALYKYSVGTQPGMADITPWTDAGTSTSACITGLSLTVGTKYYVSVRAINGAGLISAPAISAGVSVARIVNSISEAKEYVGEPVCLDSLSVTALYSNRFYVEQANRVAGIRAEPVQKLVQNQTVRLFGVVGLADGCEPAILDCKTLPGGTGPTIYPLCMITRSLGNTGLNNTGLLVRVAGRVTSVVSDGFYLDDGGGRSDTTGGIGVKVWTGAPNSAVKGAIMGVTGVVSCRMISSTTYPVVLAREINPL